MADEQRAEGAPSGTNEPADAQPNTQHAERAASATSPDAQQVADDEPELGTDELVSGLRRFINYGNTVFYTTTEPVGGSDGPDRVSARSINEADIHAELAQFVPPGNYVRASEVLHRHRFVVLTGEEGSGRRCGALALLTRSAPPDVDCRPPLIELLPDTTTSELLDISYESGRRYLLPDYTPGTITSERLRFQLDELCARLAAAGAVLVATSRVPATGLPGCAVDWHRVDCGEILDTYLRNHKHEYEYDENTVSDLRRRTEQRRPAEMPAFFGLLEREGPATIEQHFRDKDRNAVTGLLTGTPEATTLLPLVAAALTPGAVERNYETYLDRLHALVDRYAHRSPWTRAHDDHLAPSRNDRAEWITPRTHPDDPQERAVALADTVEPVFLLTELREHYGRELWGPVDEWLRKLPSTVDDRDEPALARGVATFARVDRAGAYAVLDSWAQEKELRPRWMAAMAVSVLYEDQDTADDAYACTVRWSRATRRKKIVATMAFGALGVRHPVEALSHHLWYLSLGDIAVAGTARNQIVAFVRVTYQNGNLVGSTLSTVRWQLTRQLQGTAYPDKSIGQAIRTVSAVLSAGLGDDTSLTLHVLRRLPDQISPLGMLWAEVLRSWPHRTEALETLRTAHDRLEPADRMGAFHELGQEVRQRISPPEWRWLCRDLGVVAWASTERGGDGTELGDEVDSEVSV